MEQAREKAYYELFERMVDQMTDPEHFSRPEFVDTLTRISELFHIAKGVTEFYISESYERAGDGEVLCDYDNGRGEEIAIRRRFVTKSGSVIIGTLYAAKEVLPFAPDELQKLDLIVRSLLSFVGRNRLQKAVERFAYNDEHGYPNFRSFMRHLSKLGMQGKLRDKVAAAFNLRHFSLVNQQIGRELGDAVMSNYVSLLGMAVGGDGIVCRMGGDNFVMLFERSMMDEVRGILAGVPVAYDEQGEEHVMISATAGLFVIPEGFVMQAPGEIMERIVTALQEVRQSGGETIAFYDEGMYDKREKVMRIQSLFPNALEKGEFKVFYQPKVDVETGRIVGAEALCRWFHDGQMISPGDF
ncbi:MAG: EAL domain-containing protein, partial [Lachnospiraceae bacterium]|nr:EAL domain-containing protein [Lachnospiraceae bacterium]